MAFFGAEETGSEGSRTFVASPPVPIAHVKLMINVDMIGRRLVDQTGMRWAKRPLGIDDRKAMGLIGARRFPRLRALVDVACAREGVEPLAA